MNAQHHPQLARGTALLAEFSHVSGRYNIKLLRDYISVEFSPDLGCLLGFDADVKLSQKGMTGRRSPDVIGHIHSVYVYSDILEHVPV